MKVRAKPRLDGNHHDLVKLMYRMGCTFFSTAAIPGQLDGVIGCAGIDVRCEFKDPERPASQRKLTAAEQDTFDNWNGHKPVILETENDVICLVHSLRKQAIRNKNR